MAFTLPAPTTWSLDELRLSSAEVGDDTDDVEDVAAYSAMQQQALDAADELRVHTARHELQLAAERAEAFVSGKLEGTTLEAARLRTALLAAESALNALNGVASKAEVVEENIAALAIAVARQIIGRELSLDSRLIGNLVQLSLRAVPVDQPVRVRVNPGDLRLLHELGAEATGEREVSWIGDETVSRGGCMVESRDRIVDGRVDSALERLYRRLVSLDE